MTEDSGKDSSVFDFYSQEKRKDILDKVKNATEQTNQKITFANNNKLKLLIVDDDIKTINFLSASLKFKYDVYATSNFIEALALLSQYKVALVISAQVVPNAGMVGTEFMAQARKLTPDTSRVLLANPLDFSNAKSLLQPGDVFRLFKKPFNDNRLLEVVDEATVTYLENSGSLATAAERIHKHAPNINKEIKITPSIPASANAVIIKCEDNSLFEEIKNNYKGTAHFIHAKDKEATINILENTITKAIIYCFERTNILEEPETIFINQIKQELPHLAIIALLNKEKTNYQEIIELINQNIIYSYLPNSAKVEKICQQLKAAIDLANKLYTSPLLLTWPPIEKIDLPEDKDTEKLADKLNEVSSQITDKLKSGISFIKGLFNKEK